MCVVNRALQLACLPVAPATITTVFPANPAMTSCCRFKLKIEFMSVTRVTAHKEWWLDRRIMQWYHASHSSTYRLVLGKITDCVQTQGAKEYLRFAPRAAGVTPASDNDPKAQARSYLCAEVAMFRDGRCNQLQGYQRACVYRERAEERARNSLMLREERCVAKQRIGTYHGRLS